VTGSVAAYKAVLLARLLVRAGAFVQPAMTQAALRFVGASTFAALTGRRVLLDMFDAAGELHVDLASDSDLIVVAPATADSLARLAHGRADDLISATLLCAHCPVLLAPAMHPRMWSHPITRANAEKLSQLPGWRLLGPVFGQVASGESGMGRLLEPESILAEIAHTLGAESPRAPAAGSLRGRHIVVTAGPTLEDLDPVRFLTNRSSGKMGFALARSAAAQGARVTLIAGPVSLPTPAGVERVDVRSALDMQAALARALGDALDGADALVMCAAVSDYRPESASTTKLKRTGQTRSLQLVANPDLLAEIGKARTGPSPFLLGFAVESESGEALIHSAQAKLVSKRVDAIVANAASDSLGTDDSRAVLVSRDVRIPLGPGSKAMLADQIIDYLGERLG
jgi:phosphopantothenoylcysteine decarboxylase/phosphopantothenate--cysteine ligase